MESHRRQQYFENLRLLNATLASSPLAERYAVFGGLLLGIVREGHPLVDDWDADFYYLAEDESLMVRAIEHLLAAGFERLYRFVGNDGLVWQYSFLKDDAKFEFFRTVKSDATVLQYYDFVPSSAPVQQKKSFAGLPWSNLEFLDASWLAPKEIDRSLTSMYGDWRTPDPHWCWADDPLTISRETWEHSDTLHWTEGN